MTFKTENVSDGLSTKIRLIGRAQAGRVDELKAQIKDGGPNVTFDLYDVALADFEKQCASLEFMRQRVSKSFIARRTYVTASLRSKTGGTLVTFRHG